MVVTEAGGLEPELARIVIKTCSLMLKAPGFIENVHLVPGTLMDLAGRVAAINFPANRVRIWIHSDVILTGFCR